MCILMLIDCRFGVISDIIYGNTALPMRRQAGIIVFVYFAASGVSLSLFRWLNAMRYGLE